MPCPHLPRPGTFTFAPEFDGYRSQTQTQKDRHSLQHSLHSLQTSFYSNLKGQTHPIHDRNVLFLITCQNPEKISKKITRKTKILHFGGNSNVARTSESTRINTLAGRDCKLPLRTETSFVDHS